MLYKRMRILILVGGLIALLVFMSGCGSDGQTGGTSATPLPAGKLPDDVQITLNGPSATQAPPQQVTLRSVALVQKLYQTMLALPLVPPDTACPAIAGPTYQLIFRSGTQTLTQADADRGGCGTVTFSGEKQDRLASQSFWTQLHQAIIAATPTLKPQALAIQHTLQGNRPVLTAHISNAATAQRLYNAILDQPVIDHPSCSDTQYPTYQMAFQADDQVVASSISQQCQTISLVSKSRLPDSLYRLNAHFQQVFEQTLSEATFAPAQPDQLFKEVQPGHGAIARTQVSDLARARQLYSAVFTLQRVAIGPDCPSGADKIKGTGTFYTFHFSQWDLPIMELSAYKGSCQLINPIPGMLAGQTLKGDATFWNLLQTIS